MREIVVSDEFLVALDSMPPELKDRALEKIGLLSENPAHPSLKTHRVHRTKDKWEGYITDAHRVIYEPVGDEMRLWRIGDHSIIDRAHTFSFSPHTSFRRLDPDEPMPTEETAFDIPPEWLAPREDNGLNPFTFLPGSHLRILGVPSHLVKAVRLAPTVDAAVEIHGLPERTKTWMLDLLTNPNLEEALFDPGRLIFRTTLDRLEGYCQGKIKRLMLNLEEEQKRYVGMAVDGAMLVRGCAGSGKTTVALYRAIQCAQTGGETIFLTFNRTLAAAAQGLIQELIGPMPTNLEVVNVDAWLVRFLRKRGHGVNLLSNAEQRDIFLNVLRRVQRGQRSYVHQFPWTFFRDEIGRVIKGNGLAREEDYLAIPRYGRKTALKRKARSATWEVYQQYQRALIEKGRMDWQDVSLRAYRELFKNPLPIPYEHLIIDEAQDLTAMQVRVAQRMMKGGAADKVRSIFLVGDVSQTLYSRGFSWKQAGLQVQGRSFSLRRNFRNTRQIAETAAALNSYNRLMRLSDDYVDPQFTQRQGPWPIVLRCDVTDREMRAVGEKILDLAGDNRFRLADFSVLCPTVHLCETASQRFLQMEIPSVAKGDEAFDILEERVKILTIHSAKGLEFPVVFVLGLHEGTLPHTLRAMDDEEAELALERDRTLLYVGMTRAAEALYLVTSVDKPSPFLSEIGKLLREEPFTGGKET
jgi:superfamily I DNA/RNA helicase